MSDSEASGKRQLAEDRAGAAFVEFSSPRELLDHLGPTPLGLEDELDGKILPIAAGTTY